MLQGALAAGEQGLMYALLALGVFLTFRILNFADLTVDASFTTGAASAAMIISHGGSPWLGCAVGFAAGALAGGITAVLHTVGKIDPLLASILTMLGLYSINLRIMDGKGNIGLIGQTTVFTPIAHLHATWASVAILAAGVAVFIVVLTWFLSTDLGLALRSTGDNPGMAASFGVSNNLTKTVGLMMANALVGLTGAVVCQYQGYADIQGGTGLILAGLASVILGNAILGSRFMWLALAGVAVGSILYREAIFFALKLPFVKSTDMKVISALIVVVALIVSQSAGVRAALSKLSPFRSKTDVPEPMSIVPNAFSPLATSDASSAGPETRGALPDDDWPGRSRGRPRPVTAAERAELPGLRDGEEA
jgi:putative ABC transport system permease protein